MDGFLRGLDWEMEHGSAIMLRLTADPAVWGRLVPHQLRMMQEQALDRLLPVAAGEENGKIVLHYDLAGRRRLVQRLYAEPPGVGQIADIIHRLVRTVAGCKAYMLQESGFLLHEDFVYAGRRPCDFKLVYLPLSGTADPRLMPPVSAQLRLLILRFLSFARDPLPAGMAPVFGLLSQEPFAVDRLDQMLRKLRHGGPDPDGETVGGSGSPPSGTRGGRFGVWRAGRFWTMWAARRKKTEHGRKPADAGATGAPGDKTGLLVRAPGESGTWAFNTAIIADGGGKTETVTMEGDRFLIGRSAGSVHYAIMRHDVSRIHCEICRTGEGFAVTDLGSLNGTLLNGEPMLPYRPYPFGPGDRLQVAGTVFRLAAPADQTETPETAVKPSPAKTGGKRETNRTASAKNAENGGNRPPHPRHADAMPGG